VGRLRSEQLVNGLLRWMPEFDPRPFHVGFVVDKLAV